MMAEVYWAARDLDGPPWGNHQFLVIYLNESENMFRTKAMVEGETRFVTLGGHVLDGNLVFIANQKADVDSVREVINPDLAGFWSDYDLEKHKVTPKDGGGWNFALKVERGAYQYRQNTVDSPVEYDLWDRNCATWVNTLLLVAGVTWSDRMRAGEFNGVDWGEEEKVDRALFE
jgi:hypothetical protein